MAPGLRPRAPVTVFGARSHVDALVREALIDAIERGLLRVRGVPPYTVEEPRYPAFGDLACDVAMVLARELGRSPQAIGEILLGRLHDADGWIAGVEIAGPGFLNFRLAPAFWRSLLGRALESGAAWGPGDLGRGRGVRVEQEQAALDIAGGRRAAVRGTLTRLLAATGWAVEWGGQGDEYEPPAHAGERGGRVSYRGLEQLVRVVGADRALERARLAAVSAGQRVRLRVVPVGPVRLLRDGEPVRRRPGAAGAIALRALLDEVGTDAARFLFLLRRADSPLDFDLELAKRRSTDNPVFYVQSAHARLSSAPGCAEAAGVAYERGAALGPLGEEEAEPLRAVAAWPDVVERATHALEPHRVAGFALELGAVVHRYLNRQRIVTGNPALTHARLALVRCLRQVLRGALALCGVSAPQRT